MTASSTLLPAPGEVYVGLDPVSPIHHPAFPATIDDARWNGWVQPRFRSEVTKALLAWMDDACDTDPDWFTTGHFDSDDNTLIILEGEEQDRYLITPDQDGRYPVGAGGWCWQLTNPRTPDTARHEATVLADPERFTAHPGEVLVTPDTHGVDPAFPALLDTPRDGWEVPRFRREVAEAVLAWINTTNDGFDAAYWDSDTVVLIQGEHVGKHGYLPQRIGPDLRLRYSIGSNICTWVIAPH